MIVGLCDTYIVHFYPINRNKRADFVTDFVADYVTDFCIFLSYKSVGKSFGGTYALGCIISYNKSKSEYMILANEEAKSKA